MSVPTKNSHILDRLEGELSNSPSKKIDFGLASGLIYSVNITTAVAISQAAYDALPTKDTTTLYLINS